MRSCPVLDHISLRVADYDRSRKFYEAALAPLGYTHDAFVLDPDGYNIEAVCHKAE